jgi:putative Mg2+ transporter-C (MgtC) family protein
MSMSTHLGWQDIALRLAMTVLAGTLVGLDRGQHGRPAGLRTTLLVCLAASLSMIQTNLLLPTAGKPTTSFVTLDLMRLPLGILTGMGFIGGGAILKRGDIVLGLTTAATLWFVTIIGLCFGGGQIVLGTAGLALGLIVLKGLKRLEGLLPQDQRAVLTIALASQATTEDEVRAAVLGRGFRLATWGFSYDNDKGILTLSCEVRWRARAVEPPRSGLVKELYRLPGVLRLDWRPLGSPFIGAD